MPDAPFWHKCNSHCVMCTNCDSYIEEDDSRYSIEKHREKIEEFKADPGNRNVFYRNGEHGGYFLFTGGEPTLNPDFFKLLGEYRKNFPGTPMTLLTNGRTFFYEQFAKHTMSLGGRPFEVAVPIHGPDAQTHDSVTRAPGSFLETVEGLHHLFRHQGEGQTVEIRVILHRRPAEWLSDTLKYLLETYPSSGRYRLTLVYFEVEGQAEKNYHHIKISLSECARLVDECYGLLRKFPDKRLYHFPLCVLPERLWPFAWRSLPQYEIKHVKACHDCAMNDVCMGPHDWYAQFVGVSEFEAFSRRRNIKETGNPFHPIAAVGRGWKDASPRPIQDEEKDKSAKW